MRFSLSRFPGLLISLSVFLTGCSKAPPDPLPIGLLTVHQPAESNLGGPVGQGTLLAVEEANGDPPVAGRPIEVRRPEVPNDEALTPAAARLVSVNKVNGLLASADAVPTEKLCRTAQPYSMPLIATAGLPAPALGAFAFSVGLDPVEQGKAFARLLKEDEMKKHLKVQRIALLIDTRSMVGQAAAASFADEVRKLDGFTLQQFAFGTPGDLKKRAAELADGNFEVAVLAGAVADLPALRGDKFKGAIFFAGEEESPRAPIADPGVYRATAYHVDGSLPRATEFAKKYEERFKQRPDVTAALAYDAARVLFQGLRQAKSVQGIKVRDELLQLKDFECLTGPLSIDKEHHTKRPLFIVRRDDTGQVQLVKRYDP